MTDGPTNTREQELANEFKEGLEPDHTAALNARVDELQGQVDQLQADLAAATERADAAEAKQKRAAAKISRGDKPASARKIAAVDDQPAGENLEAAIAKADKVEVVLSDGKKEITGVPPIVVTGDVWKRHPRGVMLRDPVTIDGPGAGEPSFAVAGYGLLLDGKLAAYSERADPLQVVAGTKVSLTDDIVF